MGRPPLSIDVTPKDQKQLTLLLTGGVQQVRVVLRCLVLLQLAKGASAPRISQVVPLTSQAIRTIARRYQRGGLDSALLKSSVPAPAVLDESQKQRIIGLVYSDASEGRARWTVRLVAQEAVKRRLVPHVGRETVRILLLDHDLKPWREKMWCVGELNEEYIAKVEDVLETYEKPYDPAEPVVCLDEKPVTLMPTFAALVQPRRGASYERRGTANVFCAVVPKAGRHFTFVTADRSAFEFARVACDLAMQYQDADTIHLCPRYPQLPLPLIAN
jgi:transposase